MWQSVLCIDCVDCCATPRSRLGDPTRLDTQTKSEQETKDQSMMELLEDHPSPLHPYISPSAVPVLAERTRECGGKGGVIDITIRMYQSKTTKDNNNKQDQ